MNKFEICEKILGWWSFGCVTDLEVISWADLQIERAQTGSELPCWMIELSLKGPKEFVRLPQQDYPRPERLTFLEKFSILVETTDPDDTSSVCKFVEWIASAAMGENPDVPEVNVGYQIEHALSYRNSGDPVEIARNAIRSYKLTCHKIALTLKT